MGGTLGVGVGDRHRARVGAVGALGGGHGVEDVRPRLRLAAVDVAREPEDVVDRGDIGGVGGEGAEQQRPRTPGVVVERHRHPGRRLERPGVARAEREA